jgi:fatty acid desaturase
VNPIYSIMESPHRWLILAGLSILVACVGGMAMIAYGWPHTLVRVWLYAGLALTLFFLVEAFVQWKRAAEGAVPENSESGRR